MLKQIKTMLEGEFDVELDKIDSMTIAPWKRHPKGRRNLKGFANVIYSGSQPLVRIDKKYYDLAKKEILMNTLSVTRLASLIDEDVNINYQTVYELSKVMTANVLKPKGFQFVDESVDEKVMFKCLDNGHEVASVYTKEYAQGIQQIECCVNGSQRNQGIGTYLVSQASKRLLVLGITPVIIVEPTNIYGMRLVNSLNYSPVFTEIMINE